MEFEKLAGRLGLEVDEFLELAELFLETGNKGLIGLKEALSNNDIQEVVEKAHSLKGASGNLGFSEIYEKAKQVENNARDDILDGADKEIVDIDNCMKDLAAVLQK